jgi:hypothetical protein
MGPFERQSPPRKGQCTLEAVRKPPSFLLLFPAFSILVFGYCKRPGRHLQDLPAQALAHRIRNAA